MLVAPGMEGGGSVRPPASKAEGAEMEGPRKDDLLLDDEKFNLDLLLSSLSANKDDEVFFGPVGHKERCIATSLEFGNVGPSPPQPPLWALGSLLPLEPSRPREKFVEVYKEARLLTLPIESSSQSAILRAPTSQGCREPGCGAVHTGVEVKDAPVGERK